MLLKINYAVLSGYIILFFLYLFRTCIIFYTFFSLVSYVFEDFSNLSNSTSLFYSLSIKFICGLRSHHIGLIDKHNMSKIRTEINRRPENVFRDTGIPSRAQAVPVFRDYNGNPKHGATLSAHLLICSKTKDAYKSPARGPICMSNRFRVTVCFVVNWTRGSFFFFFSFTGQIYDDPRVIRFQTLICIRSTFSTQHV